MDRPKSCDADVAVIGAGVAGLAAAAHLRAHGVRVVVLEAASRAGGRAHTVTPPQWGGEAADLGASWFHKAAHNPLAKIAHARGVATLPFAPAWHLSALPSPEGAARPVLLVNDPARDAADDAFHAALPHPVPVPDVSLLQAWRQSGAAGPWLATVATMEGALFSAADAADLSFADWHENALDDDNLWPRGGMGAFVVQHLAPEAGPILFDWTVDLLDWNAPFGGVSIAGARGIVRVAACVLTVSTGVLRQGGIRFVTPLPEQHCQALEALPMGLLSKVIFPAMGDLAALAPDTSIEHRVESVGDAAMFFIARPAGASQVIGHVGGRAAWDLAHAGLAAQTDFARRELASIFGFRARAWLPEGAAILSSWGQDRLFAGAYSYGRPGCGDARDALAAPVGGGRLTLAGEACHRGMSGTVQAAWITGHRAADALVKGFGA